MNSYSLIKTAILALLPGVFLLGTGLVWAEPAEVAEGVDSPVVLRLGEVLARVEAENLRVLMNRETVVQAVQLVVIERSTLLPSVDLNVSQVRTRPSLVGTGFGGLPGTPRTVPPANRFDAGLRADLAVLDPVRIARYQAAKSGENISRYDYQAVVQDILQSAATVFFAHLRNLERMQVIEANIEREQELLRLAQSRYNAGAATKIDVTRSEVQLSRQLQQRLQQQTVVLESALRLKRFLNMDLYQEVRPVPVGFSAVPLEREDHGLSLDRILTNRADYQAAVGGVERGRIERRAASWERFPAVSLFGEYGFATETAFDGGEQNEWMVGIALNMPVFEGFRIRANQRIANSRLRSSEYRAEDLSQNIAAEVELAWQDSRSRLAQISVAADSLRLAQEELRLALRRFEEGATDNRDVVDAQNSVVAASDNLVEAEYFYNLARLDLARARGDVRFLLGEQVLDPEQSPGMDPLPDEILDVEDAP